MQQRALARARRPHYRHKRAALESQAYLIKCAHVLTTDPVLANNVAELDRQRVTWRITGIGSCVHSPPARAQHSAGRDVSYATDCHSPATASQRHWYQYNESEPQSV